MAKAGSRTAQGGNGNGNGNEGDGNAHNTNSQPEEVLRVRYKGRSDQRVLWSSGASPWGLVWRPESEIPYDVFVQMAGTREHANEILRAHQHEFELVGPGAREFWDETDGDAEEFSVEGPVE